MRLTERVRGALVWLSLIVAVVMACWIAPDWIA